MDEPTPCKDLRFELPKDYDPQDHFDRALWLQPGEPEKVELAFSQQSLRFIGQRVYQPSQTWSRMDDGRLLMTLEVPAGEGDY